MSVLAATADPPAIAATIRGFLDTGRAQAAAPLIAALRKMVPTWPDLRRLTIRFLVLEQRLDEALAEADRAVAAAPADPLARLDRAEMRLRLGDVAGAAGDAAEAVAADRNSARAKAMLGRLLLELRLYADAATCLAEADIAHPRQPDIVAALARAQRGAGDPISAARTLEQAIAQTPDQVGLRSAAIALAMETRDFVHAADLAEAARRAGVADAAVFVWFGHALSELDRYDDAAEAYRNARRLAPENPEYGDLVAACAIASDGDDPLPDRVAALFDARAERYDADMRAVGCRVPALLRSALAAHVDCSRGPIGPVLDLGCGTGRMAVALADLPLGPITGLDCSGGMLAHARATRLYATCLQSDIVEGLAGSAVRWRLMLAADTFTSFDRLDVAFPQVRESLQPGGHLILSVDEMSERDARAPIGWRRTRAGRFAHRSGYVAACAAQSGLAVVSSERDILRCEADGPVLGRIVVLRRPPGV